jgi:glycosyltransferase involved in cell wall biosynthesis
LAALKWVNLLRILILPGNDWIFGPQQYLHDLAEKLGKKHDVFVWHFNLFRNRKPCLQKIENVKLIRPWSVYSSSLLVYYGVNFLPHSIFFARIVRKLGIDVVIVANLIPALWAFSLSSKKVLKVFAFQDYFPESVSAYYKNFPRTFSRILESFAYLINKLSLKLANLALCPCFSLINLSEKMGCKRNYFIPNGVDTNFFDPKKSNPKLREELGLSKYTLVFYGLIESWLDFGTVFAGFRILKKEFPSAKLLIVGSTLTNHTKVLEKLVQDENLTKDIVLTGYVPNELVAYYLNLGNICLMPYKTDNFSGKIRLPLKLFIYSAMGKTILSVPLPEVKRLNPKHVFFYNDPESFARQASMIFKNNRLQDDLEYHAREFSKNFDYSKIAQECEAILEKNLPS